MDQVTDVNARFDSFNEGPENNSNTFLENALCAYAARNAGADQQAKTNIATLKNIARIKTSVQAQCERAGCGSR